MDDDKNDTVARCLAELDRRQRASDRLAAALAYAEDSAPEGARRTRAAKAPRSQRATWVQRQCPDPERARRAFLDFQVPPGCRVCPPAEVRGFVRLVLFCAHHPITALSVLLDGDLGRFAGQYTSAVLQGQRPVAADEWARIRALVERLAVGLSLEQPEPEPAAGVDLGAVMGARLARPATRSRDAVNPELIGLAMLGPLVDGPPRAVRPREASYLRAAA